MTIIGQPAYPVLEWAWTPAQARLYALAIGAPGSVMDERDLRLVTTDEPEVFPTFAMLLADAHSLRRFPLPGIEYNPLDVIYAGHELQLVGPLPASASGTTTSRILSVGDVRSGVLVRRESVSHDDAGRFVARNVVTSIIRGASVGSPAPSSPGGAEPTESPIELEVPTLPTQAIVYAQTGDDSPLHWDPAAARAQGFERPILHGLCSVAMVVHRLLRDVVGQRWDALRRVEVRFTSPVVPGETLRVRAARTDGQLQFSTWVRGRTGERQVHGRGVVEVEL